MPLKGITNEGYGKERVFLLPLIAWIILPVRGDHDALFGNLRVFICMD